MTEADEQNPVAASAARVPQSFPGHRRLLRPAEFQKVYQTGIRRPTRHFVVFAQPRPGGNASRVGVTVGRKVGPAVVRNRIRRRTREIVRRHWQQLAAGWDIVINPRRAVLDASFGAIEEELVTELRRLGERGVRC